MGALLQKIYKEKKRARACLRNCRTNHYLLIICTRVGGSKQNMKKSTIALCAVCLVFGLIIGVALCQPEIHRQRDELSLAGTQINELQTQLDELESSRLDLLDQIEMLQGDLESANAELQEVNHELEILENGVEYLSAYVEKDLEFLSLLLERLENYQFADLTLLVELGEASYDVDPSIGNTINSIVDDIERLLKWSTRMPLESAPCEERYTWLLEGYQIIGQYLIDYREFAKSFLEPIEMHLEAIRGLSLAD